MRGADESAVRIGTCAWSFDDWRGLFYPKNLPQNEWLGFYSRYFSAVEADSTFYRVPEPRVAGRWLDDTPESFQFACKMPRVITHERHLGNCEEALEEFHNAVAPLRAKLGCVLIQMPASFTPDEYERNLKRFIPALSGEFRYAIEFRSPGWHIPRIIHLLEEHRICWVWNDLTPLDEQGRAAYEFLPRTTDFLYLRLMGDPRTKYKADGTRVHRYGTLLWPRETSLESWALKIKKHIAEAAPIFIFLNNHFEGFSPLSAQRLASNLGIDLALPDLEQIEEASSAQLRLL